MCVAADRICAGAGGFKVESGRYHLYVSHACPWVHRTMIYRSLTGLEDHIGVSVVHPDMLSEGWTFATDFPGATGDRLFGSRFVRDIYLRAKPAMTGRVTVPILWDTAQGTIVSNESSEIIRMFNSAFDRITGDGQDFYPDPLRGSIAALNSRICDTLNNGVCKAGCATSQAAYDRAVHAVFEALGWIKGRLAQHRCLTGDRVAGADWRLFPTIARFDAVYHLHSKCNRARIVDYPNL